MSFFYGYLQWHAILLRGIIDKVKISRFFCREPGFLPTSPANVISCRRRVTSAESLSAAEPVQQAQVAAIRVVGFQVLTMAGLSSCHLCALKKKKRKERRPEWATGFFSPPTNGHLQSGCAFKPDVAALSFLWPWWKHRGSLYR